MSLFKRLVNATEAPSATAIPSAVGEVIAPAFVTDSSSLFVLPADALLGVAGESHHPDAIAALIRSGAENPSALAVSSETAEDVAKRECDRDLCWFEAQLLPMPDNPYDANAVAVVSTHGHVGYLPRASTAEYAEVFDSLRRLGYAGAICPAFVDAGRGSAVLVISWPSICQTEINAERHRQAWEVWKSGEDLESAATRLDYASPSTLLTAARTYAGERGLEMPPTASKLESRSV